MRHRSGRSRWAAVVSISAALAISAALPSIAAGQSVIDGLLGDLGGGGGVQEPRQENGTGYQPPLHGDNPHGQGTAVTVDLLPNGDLPYSGDPDGFAGDEPMGSEEDVRNGEEVVIGRSRGEQENPYHGHVTILALFGQEILGIDTNEGESEEFNPLNQAVLNEICAESEGALCLAVLDARSETESDGSWNHFSGARLSSDSELGSGGVTLLESNGNIEEDSTCQRSHGDSQVVHAFAGRDSEGLSVSALGSSADSEACNDGASSQNNDSHVLLINDEEACEGETLISLFILAFVCNADDTNGVGEPVQQAPLPYGVREALSFFLFPTFLPENGATARQEENGELALLKLTAAASESHAVAPPVQGDGPAAGPVDQGAGALAGKQPGGGPGGPDGSGGPEGGPAAAGAQPGDGRLAFTGVDVLLAVLMGLGLLGAGLALTAMNAVRRGA